MITKATKYHIPDPLAKDSEKRSDAYGLNIAKLIAEEWFNGGTITDSCEYGKRRDWIRNNRLFVRGEQDEQPYKDHIARQEGDLEYLNLDWRPLNIAEKFCNIVSNGISDSNYRLDIRAVDKVATKLKKDREDYHKKNMYAQKLFENTKKALGIDLSPKGFVPDDLEELGLYMEIKERPKIEIAEEIMIDYVKKTNDYHNIEEQKNKDLVVNGIAVSRVYTDPNNGVMVEYVDPEYFVHSQVTKNDFGDAYYFGQVSSITINDIKRESDFDEKTLRKIAKSYATANTYQSPRDFMNCPFQDIVDVTVDVLRFAYKSTKNIVYKKSVKKGDRVKVTRKDDNYNPPERNDYGRIDQTLDTWYEGTFVLGTDFIYNYKECENLVRGEQNKVKPPFTVRAVDIYKNKLNSFLQTMRPTIDQMQYIHLKTQHLIAELKPDITEIDPDVLVEFSDGDGGVKRDDLNLALNLLNVKGVSLKKRIDMGEMGIKESSAARTVGSVQGSALGALLNSWQHYYNLLRDLTGINQARDGSQPSDTLVGVNEMQQMASNTATKHIVDAAIYFNKTNAEVISSRLHGIFSYKSASHLRKIYEKAVGTRNLDALEQLKDRNLHDFGFTVEMMPTQEEVKEFKEDLMIAMQEGFIDIEVKQQAQQIFRTNHKLANQYLQYRRRKAIKQKMAEREHEAMLQSQSNAAAAQSSAQSQMQLYQGQAQVDLKKEQGIAQIEVLKQQALQQLKDQENYQNFKYDAYLKKLEGASQMAMKDFLENRKDDRTKLQASQQSKILEQRNNDSGAIDFENDFDLRNFRLR